MSDDRPTVRSLLRAHAFALVLIALLPSILFLIPVAKQEVFYTPLYYVMSHFSKFIKPDARVLGTSVTLASGVATTVWLALFPPPA